MSVSFSAYCLEAQVDPILRSSLVPATLMKSMQAMKNAKATATIKKAMPSMSKAFKAMRVHFVGGISDFCFVIIDALSILDSFYFHREQSMVFFVILTAGTYLLGGSRGGVG